MFFFIAVLPIKKLIPYNLNGICKHCGNVCNYEIIMTANCLSIFFIPIFKWGKQYFVRNSCCGALFSLDKSVGNAIADGENIAITDASLTLIDEDFSKVGTCPYCGNEINEDFEYCPKCGKKL
ncbi:zinc ribbon domain-containing protein [Lachnospiraceae bacterium NSJ-143]|nr:zinc ribbon domain-containing protein [Lachnospiraceae bacterium NSJ-143]